jgi:hypothetical protein
MRGRARSVLLALVTIIAIQAHRQTLAAAPSLDLRIELDPGTRRFKALARVVPASRDFRFDLYESLDVTAASADGKPLPVVSTGHEGQLRGWRVALPLNADTLRLEYGGRLPALDRHLDQRDVLRSLPPMASQEGSFLPAGGAWYPQPAALFSYRLAVSMPADQRALVPGRLESEELPAGGVGRYRASFAFIQPVGGIDLMAGPWIVREKMVPRAAGAPLRLRTYFFRDLDAISGLADGYLDDARRYLDLYSAQIGAYPFTEFSVVASPLPAGFGMPTLTYLSAKVLKLPFIRATSLGHEVLHNWWGNGVYVDYAQGNWSEGLTTFMADYAYKQAESNEAARAMRLGWLRDFAATPTADLQSLASFHSRSHGATATTGYGKSAMLFVMLRDAIGAQGFRRGIRIFWAEHRFRVASWNDLRLAFERASGQPLATFFTQWIQRTGAPAVTITGARAKASAGKFLLTLSLEQSVPPYALRLPVEVVYRSGSETRWIETGRQRDTASLTVDALPAGVRLDPDVRVWRMLDQEQLPPILRQWILSRAPRLALASPAADVRQAAESLAARLFENTPRVIALSDVTLGSTPVLLVGMHADIDAALVRAGIAPRPASLAHRGSAQVWTVNTPTGTPVAVVSVRDVEALRTLLRPLPHYGAQSWLIFEGGRMIERGIWHVPGRLVTVQRVP